MTKYQSRLSILTTALLMTTASSAFAAGTLSGTVVTNTIDVSYTSGGNTVTINDAATATFTVDRRIDLLVEGQDAAKTVTAAQGLDEVVLTFLVTNEGNSTQGYDIDVTSLGTIGLTYDPMGAGAEGTYHVVSSIDAVLDPADAILDVNGITNFSNLAPDEFRYIFVVANIPNDALDLQQDDFTVAVTTLDAGTNIVTMATPVGTLDLDAEDIIFADPGLDGFEADLESLLITAPQLSYSKVESVLDENRDGMADCAIVAADPAAEASSPGACMLYTITITNDASATAAAQNVIVTDMIPAQVTYEAHNVGTFSTVTFDAGAGPEGTVTGTLATLAPGATASFTIRAEVK